MGILDAKDPLSWQMGFEDGIKFHARNFQFSNEPVEVCEHLWATSVLTSYPNKVQCTKCGALKTV